VAPQRCSCGPYYSYGVDTVIDGASVKTPITNARTAYEVTHANVKMIHEKPSNQVELITQPVRSVFTRTEQETRIFNAAGS
jgi:hypothetical protein